MTEVEKHHLAAIRVTINLAKKHCWMLELVCESLLRKRIFSLKVSPPKMPINLEGKRESLQWEIQQIPSKTSDQN